MLHKFGQYVNCNANVTFPRHTAVNVTFY